MRTDARVDGRTHGNAQLSRERVRMQLLSQNEFMRHEAAMTAEAKAEEACRRIALRGLYKHGILRRQGGDVNRLYK